MYVGMKNERLSDAARYHYKINKNILFRCCFVFATKRKCGTKLNAHREVEEILLYLLGDA